MTHLDPEYDPERDPAYGERVSAQIDWRGNRFLPTYLAKLRKGWPAQMAAAAGRRAERGETRWIGETK